MKNHWLKTFSIIAVFFLLDLIRPFGYSLSVEFLFLGVLIISAKESLKLSLAASFLAAWLRDFFIFSGPLLSIIEFPLICLFIHYLRSDRLFLAKQKHIFIAKAVIVFLSLLLHVLLNSLQFKLILPFFYLRFIIQSICLYYLIDYLLSLKSRSDLGHEFF